MASSGAWRAVAAGAALITVYFGAGKLGLSLATVHSHASPVWPCTGVALAAFLLLGYRCFPAIMLGSFLVDVTTGGTVATALGIALGSSLEGLAGAYLVNRFAGGTKAFDRPGTLFRFFLFGAVGATTISPTIGVASLALGGFVEPGAYDPIWLTWWLGDTVGAIVFTPLIVLWVRQPRLAWSGRQVAEATCLLFTLVLVCVVSFGLGPWGAGSYPLKFLPVPMLIWAAFRFGSRETATASLVLSIAAIWGTMSGFGQFVELPQPRSLVMLQIFLGFVTGMGLTVAAVVNQSKAAEMALRGSTAFLDDKVRERTAKLAETNRVLAAEIAERQQAQKELIESEAMFRDLMESAPDALLIVALDGTIRMVNSQTEKFFGYDRKQLLGQPVEMLIPERFREQHVANRTSYSANPHPRAMGEGLELYGTRKDGSEFSVDISLSPLNTKEGPMLTASIRDVTKRKRAESERRATETLRNQVEELSRRTREISTLNEMGDLLRAANSVGEMSPLVPKFMQTLFPGDSGALYVFNSTRTFLEAVASWGESPPTEAIVKRDECWALRRGQIHRVEDAGSGDACQHLTQPRPDTSLCIPMMAHGESLGLLHLYGAAKDKNGGTGASLAEYRQWLAQATAAQIAGSLANAKLQETLRQHASRDSLTNLLNRRSFEESLECELQRSARRKSRLGLLMIDLDHFKRFNDRFGHAAGDLALREISALLGKRCRKGDLVCRFGGEELTVALVDCTAKGAEVRAKQIQEAARTLRLTHEGRALGAVTLSIGVALFPDHGRTVEDLLRAADKALYRAKGEGRNQTVVAPATQPLKDAEQGA